jgi:UDP-N-acetylmuramyl pentapeptide synthase
MDIQVDIVEPDIALFTKLSPSHIEGFGTAEKYFAEKEKILRRKIKQTYAIGNSDDHHQSDFVCQSWYGSDAKKSDFTLQDIREFPDRTEFVLAHGEEHYSLVTPILGKHHTGLVAGALMVGLQMGIPALDVVSFLRHIHLPHARGNTLKGLHDSLVIDGTYNGGFDPIVAGVEMLARLAQTE